MALTKLAGLCRGNSKMNFLSKPWRFALAAILVCASIPASATVWKWSQTAATNSSSDSTINWAEGMAPSAVNDSARAVMAAIAKWRDDLAGSKPSNAILEVAGSGTAYTLTSNQTLTALTNGFTITFRVGSGLGNTGALTIAVDSLAAKSVQGVNGTALTGGELVEGSIYTVTYFTTADVWLLHNFYAGSAATPPGSVTAYAGTSAPSGWLLAYGQCVSRTTYAALFAIISTTYDASSGCTGSEFPLPDLRGRVPAGQDDMGGSSANRLTDAEADSLNGDTLSDTGGVETQALSEAETRAHTHTGPSHTHGAGSYAVDTSITNGSTVIRGTAASKENGSGSTYTTVTSAVSDTLVLADGDVTGTSSAGGTGNTGSTGSSEAVGVVQPTIILNYIIKT
jgi:microcystin-dependent protein